MQGLFDTIPKNPLIVLCFGVIVFALQIYGKVHYREIRFTKISSALPLADGTNHRPTTKPQSLSESARPLDRRISHPQNRKDDNPGFKWGQVVINPTAMMFSKFR